MKEEKLKRLIESNCGRSNPQNNVQASIRKIKSIIKEWNPGVNGNIPKKIDDLKTRIADLEDIPVQGLDLDNYKMELEELCLVRVSMLRQQSRISWLKEGDRNTKFFHQSL